MCSLNSSLFIVFIRKKKVCFFWFSDIEKVLLKRGQYYWVLVLFSTQRQLKFLSDIITWHIKKNEILSKNCLFLLSLKPEILFFFWSGSINFYGYKWLNYHQIIIKIAFERNFARAINYVFVCVCFFLIFTIY